MEHSKTCSKCGQTKTLEEFHKRSISIDQLTNSCKSCNNTYNANYRKNNYQKVLLASKRWKQANPEKVKDYRKQWKSENPIAVSVSNSNYYKNNIEKFEIATKKWKSENPEKVSFAKASYRARKAKAKTFVVVDKDLLTLKNGTCIYCGANSEQIDHIIPLSRGGDHSIGNLAPACKRCNTSKNDKTIMEWRILKIRRGDNVETD